MIALLLHRTLTADEIASIEADINDFVIYRLPQCNVEYLPKNWNIQVVDISDEERKKINYQVLDEVLEFGNIRVEGKRVHEWFTFGKANVWLYVKFRTYFQIRNLYYDLFAIEKLAGLHDRVELFTSDGVYVLNDVLPVNVKVNHLKGTSSPLNIKSVFNFLVVSMVRFVKGFWQRKNFKNVTHLVTHRPKDEHPMLQADTLQIEPENIYLGYLLCNLDSHFGVIEEISTPKFREKETYSLQWRRLRSRKGGKNIFGEHILLTGLFQSSVRKNINKDTQDFQISLAKVKNAVSGRTHELIVKNISALKGSIKYFFWRYHAYRAFFRRSDFKTITTIDENSPFFKTVLDAAKSESIKTIAVMHGTLHPLHPGYRFTKEESDLAHQADLTLVWGEYWRRFLVEFGNYPAEKMEVTGQIRTDIIPRLKNLTKSEVIEELDDKRPVVIYATQPQRDPELRARAALDVFAMAAKFPAIQLVLQLHPAEKNDLDYFHQLAKQENCQNYFLAVNSDLFMTISICDILITCFSTVGAETIYFDKPLIILDHLAQDIQSYHKAGVAFQAVNGDELVKYVDQILSKKISHSEESYRAFIENYAFKIDGKVVKRTLQAIRMQGNS